jgi:hypothetical protein
MPRPEENPAGSPDPVIGRGADTPHLGVGEGTRMPSHYSGQRVTFCSPSLWMSSAE